MIATAEQLRAVLGDKFVDTPNDAVTFKLVEHKGKWSAIADCPSCQSSFSSGEWLPSMRAAVNAARDGLANHKRVWGTSCTPRIGARAASASAAACKKPAT